jgi:Mrp family chromosome partitioning ATPase
MRRTLLSLVKTVASAVERSNVIMVASASPGEGKSFIALNLARSMAADRDVLLVDADFKKPELSAVFGLQGRPGLLDVLAGATSFHECVRPAEQPRLSVLPAGPWRDDAGDLLTGRAADELFGSDFAVDPKRIVILDTSPILYTPEPHLVAELVGQIVFVVRAGVTAQGAFEHAVEKIGSTKQRSVILNEANTVPFASHPSYSYAYSAYGPYRAAGAANVQK